MKDQINLRNGCRLLLVLLLLLLLILAGCKAEEPAQSVQTTATDPSVTTTETTQETVPETEPPTAPPDGDPSDVTCQGSYTDTEIAGDTVVAAIGEEVLTNRMLQVYYWMEVAQYLKDNPDVTFSQGLDTLLCDLDDTAVTYQQYFLQRALNTWHSRQALYLYAGAVDLPTEEAYDPNEDYHEININQEMPAVDHLYGYVHQNYKPNALHQAYLDNLPALLEELAAAAGYADAGQMVLDLAGSGADTEALVEYARLYNWDYMYYTQLTYDMNPTVEELDAWLAEHPEYGENGLVPGTRGSVTIRQILLVPEGASVAADGTVTADEEAWEACRVAAEDMLYRWSQSVISAKRFARADNVDEALFGELALVNSTDAGSRKDGGLYSFLKPGQLVEPLDAWCFAEERQNGDTAVIRTDCGYHLVYYISGADACYAQAEADLKAAQTQDVIQTAMITYPMTVDYSTICLGTAPQEGALITAEDLLYPDVAHQRYPTAPVYLQQDYPRTRYGAFPIATYGCGITTLSMLATYMTDEELTPPELCKVYGYYNTEQGSNFSMFELTPSEMGFYLVKRTHDWEEVIAALENGQVVVSLQKKGYWTKGGHFILLEKIREDGLIQVRDSNLYNYGKLSGHQIDGHTADVITPKSAAYWIYEPKVVTTPGCVRCGDPSQADVVTAMFTGDYHCDTCVSAMARRGCFTDVMALLKDYRPEAVVIPGESTEETTPEATDETIPETTEG